GCRQAHRTGRALDPPVLRATATTRPPLILAGLLSSRLLRRKLRGIKIVKKNAAPHSLFWFVNIRPQLQVLMLLHQPQAGNLPDCDADGVPTRRWRSGIAWLNRRKAMIVVQVGNDEGIEGDGRRP